MQGLFGAVAGIGLGGLAHVSGKAPFGGNMVASGILAMVVTVLFFAALFTRTAACFAILKRPRDPDENLRIVHSVAHCLIYFDDVNRMVPKLRAASGKIDGPVLWPFGWSALTPIPGIGSDAGLHFANARVAEVEGTGLSVIYGPGAGFGRSALTDPRYVLLDAGRLSIDDEGRAGLNPEVPGDSPAFALSVVGLALASIAAILFVVAWADPSRSPGLWTISAMLLAVPAAGALWREHRRERRHVAAYKAYYDVR